MGNQVFAKKQVIIMIAVTWVLSLLTTLAIVYMSPSIFPTQTDQNASPLAYDSGWIDITDKRGQYFYITHGLNSTNVTVDIQGKTTPNGGAHQINIGGTGSTSGWSRTHGTGEGHDYALDIVQTSDGGYAIAGEGFAHLVKTDSSGDILWSEEYGTGSRARSVVQTSDGGYAIAGDGSGGAGYLDFWLARVSANGTEIWSKTYGGAGADRCASMVQTSDGGYALCGSTESFGASADFWLVKTDATGNLTWSRTFGGSDRDWAMSVVQASDGGYAMAGYTSSFGAVWNDAYLIKTDASGNMQWNYTYGGDGIDEAWSVIQTSDGGYALAGRTSTYGSGGEYFWLVKTNSMGNQQWNKTYGGSSAAYCVIQTSDGEYALAGYTYSGSYPETVDSWLVKTDVSGNMQWSKTYGGADGDWFGSMVQTRDGGYLLVGWTFSFGSGVAMWLVRTDARTTDVVSGLAWTDSSADTIRLYRGENDQQWNFVRVRVWKIRENP